MESEINNFIKVWLSIFISLCYCYGIGKKVSIGVKRLVLFLPIICLFLFLPLNLYSAHLGGFTAFFIAWLCNFKLLLFAFGKGPLSSDSSISLSRFIAVSCLPIKIQQNPPPKSHQNGQNRDHPPQKSLLNSQNGEDPSPKSHQNGQNRENPPPKSHLNGQNGEHSSPKSNQNGQNGETPSAKKLKDGRLNYAIKGVLLAILVRVYDYSEYIHPNIILLLYSFHVYFLLEIILAMGAALARTLLGIELEPQFNEPFLSTSLQDFWGKRWNLMVTRILHPSVYEPTLKIATRVTGRKWAPLPAVMGTFFVSALMHELMFYYLGRQRPTWETTWFFLIHGFCLTAEIAMKKLFKDTCRVPRLVSGSLTVGFVMMTGFWLFFPQFVRCKVDVKAFEEYAAIGAFVKNMGQFKTYLFS